MQLVYILLGSVPYKSNSNYIPRLTVCKALVHDALSPATMKSLYAVFSGSPNDPSYLLLLLLLLWDDDTMYVQLFQRLLQR